MRADVGSVDDGVCGLCGLQTSRYTCPRCNVRYCSLGCYRSARHAACTEAFARDGVVSVLRGARAGEAEQRRMVEILRRMKEREEKDVVALASGGAPPASYGGGSDDEEGEDEDEEVADPEADALHAQVLARLEAMDIEAASADELWEALPPVMQRNFRKLVAQGNLDGLPEWSPWWIAVSAASSGSVFELDEVNKAAPAPLLPLDAIPPLVQLVRSEPNPDLYLHLADILFSYAMASRTFRGLEASERGALDMLVSLSRSLSARSKFVYGSAEALVAELMTRSAAQHRLAVEAVLAVARRDVLPMIDSKECCSLALRHAQAVLAAANVHKAAERKLFFFCSWIGAQPRSSLRALGASLHSALAASEARQGAYLEQLRAQQIARASEHGKPLIAEVDPQ